MTLPLVLTQLWPFLVSPTSDTSVAAFHASFVSAILLLNIFAGKQELDVQGHDSHTYLVFLSSFRFFFRQIFLSLTSLRILGQLTYRIKP